MSASSFSFGLIGSRPARSILAANRRLRHLFASLIVMAAHPVRLGERLIEGVDRLGDHAVEGRLLVAPELNERVWRFVGGLSIRRALISADELGARFIDELDRLGHRLRERLGIAEWTGPVNRLPRFTLLYAGMFAAIFTMLVMVSYQNSQTGNEWLTESGAAVTGMAAPQSSSHGMSAAGMSAMQMSSSSAPAQTSGSPAQIAGAGAATGSNVHAIRLVVDPLPLGGKRGPDGKVHDAFVPAGFTMKLGATYKVTVLNYDDMPHTWTSPALGVNAWIPTGSKSSPSRTTFVIHPTSTGTFAWYCATPCDSYSMSHDGYMRGHVTVVA